MGLAEVTQGLTYLSLSTIYNAIDLPGACIILLPTLVNCGMRDGDAHHWVSVMGVT